MKIVSTLSSTTNLEGLSVFLHKKKEMKNPQPTLVLQTLYVEVDIVECIKNRRLKIDLRTCGENGG